MKAYKKLYWDPVPALLKVIMIIGAIALLVAVAFAVKQNDPHAAGVKETQAEMAELGIKNPELWVEYRMANKLIKAHAMLRLKGETFGDRISHAVLNIAYESKNLEGHQITFDQPQEVMDAVPLLGVDTNGDWIIVPSPESETNE